MTYLRRITLWLSHWIDDVACAVIFATSVFRASRQVQFVEQPDGSFFVSATPKRSSARALGEPIRIDDGRIVGALSAATLARMTGSAIEIVLSPNRFMFRPLELPRRAADFLEGIVRAQIDRLTPWSSDEAAFGWTAPKEIANGRIAITVAATARTLIAPIARAVSALRADSVVVTTRAETADGGAARIVIFEQRSGGERKVRRVRRLLIGAGALTGLAACVAGGVWLVVGAELGSQLGDLERRLAERHAALVSGRGSVADDAVTALERKKRETPAAVLVLEALSQILPDNTYLTELRVEGGKLQIAGMTRDAPALIRLIEQSQHFASATFFAPTTRASNENAERFHIEAQIEPFFSATP